MESLHEFFRALDEFVLGALGYMTDGLTGRLDYREGFGAGIVFLILLVSLYYVFPYAWRRMRRFLVTRPPSLTPTDPPVDLGAGCVGGGLIYLLLIFLFFGMIWGLT